MWMPQSSVPGSGQGGVLLKPASIARPLTGNVGSPLMLFPFGNWGQSHAHYYSRLCDCFHGPRNDRWRVVGPFPFDRRNGSASIEILRNDNRNDIWRPCHGWPWAGLAPASRDNWPRLEPILARRDRSLTPTKATKKSKQREGLDLRRGRATSEAHHLQCPIGPRDWAPSQIVTCIENASGLIRRVLGGGQMP
jgi:hypothetical protein